MASSASFCCRIIARPMRTSSSVAGGAILLPIQSKNYNELLCSANEVIEEKTDMKKRIEA
jgi:hypothetical protein